MSRPRPMPLPRPRRGRLRSALSVLSVGVVLACALVLVAPAGSAGSDGSASATALADWHAEQPMWVQLVNQGRSLVRAAAASGGPLERPARGVVTSGFGARVLPSFGEPVHLGIDIAAPHGAEVSASAAGVVLVAEQEEAVGNVVVVLHAPLDNGRALATLYGHLQELLVVAGQRVAAGQQIGTVGSTGTHALGAHVHFEVHVDGEPVDPADWL